MCEPFKKSLCMLCEPIFCLCNRTFINCYSVCLHRTKMLEIQRVRKKKLSWLRLIRSYPNMDLGRCGCCEAEGLIAAVSLQLDTSS